MDASREQVILQSKKKVSRFSETDLLSIRSMKNFPKSGVIGNLHHALDLDKVGDGEFLVKSKLLKNRSQTEWKHTEGLVTRSFQKMRSSKKSETTSPLNLGSKFREIKETSFDRRSKASSERNNSYERDRNPFKYCSDSNNPSGFRDSNLASIHDIQGTNDEIWRSGGNIPCIPLVSESGVDLSC